MFINTRMPAQVQITVHLGDVSGKLQVQDDGIGFDTKQMEEFSTQRQGHYGLQGIRERLELIAGEMSIESESGVWYEFDRDNSQRAFEQTLRRKVR